MSKYIEEIMSALDFLSNRVYDCSNNELVNMIQYRLENEGVNITEEEIKEILDRWN